MREPNDEPSHPVHGQMPPGPHLTPTEVVQLSRIMMRRQAKLSLGVAVVFVVILVGLPLLNLFAKDLMAANVMGFPVTWLFLGILFYPLSWILSTYFVKRSDQIEHESADWRALLKKADGK